jgi:hypothetical protein
MLAREVLRPKSILLDAVLIGGALVAANFIFGADALGWPELNPSPYLLLPVLIGGRYGFTAGILAGAGTSALVAALLGAGSGEPFADTLAAHVYLLASLVFLGGVAGELFGWFRREQAQANAQLDKLQNSVRRLDADVRHLRGLKDEFDRAVAARDGEISTLDAELRRLYTTSRDDLPAAILGFLKRQVRLVDAALYECTDTGRLRRASLFGRERHLPEAIDPATCPMVRHAIDRRSLVLLPELLHQQEIPAEENILLAAPLCDADGRVLAVVAVAGLPFINFNTQTADLIALICGWSGEVLDLAGGAAAGRYRVVPGRESQRIFTREHFRHLLSLAFEATRGHRLPSSVVVFSLPGANASEQGRFEQTIVGAMRAGDYAADLRLRGPHLAVLLPLVGERGASIFIERVRQFLRQSGPWPAEVDIRRIEIGLATELAELVAQVDGTVPAPRSAPPAS